MEKKKRQLDFSPIKTKQVLPNRNRYETIPFSENTVQGSLMHFKRVGCRRVLHRLPHCHRHALLMFISPVSAQASPVCAVAPALSAVSHKLEASISCLHHKAVRSCDWSRRWTWGMSDSSSITEAGKDLIHWLNYQALCWFLGLGGKK